jgi:hypothetical protein
MLLFKILLVDNHAYLYKLVPTAVIVSAVEVDCEFSREGLEKSRWWPSVQ